ncbi:MAG: hypothetical protein A3F84_09395 [Candidatus Handelsmanbacteria bacterium RIFCSPLOWO2_12_FULL_64_10]|uniref:Lipoprotein n=1 Tax=Handelsmanbacteria sp. (strain RIFCSPLOWO2_12_FULL_64_10) TaxID=1817868 RepID=A0A1F6C7T5_HANXR|nr:MAG: hypothetical protein A3F84_09395 [Candidatus Handelsmanbacteria bacterium RIFCSPLOWO2_12_FULL_64_10]
MKREFASGLRLTRWAFLGAVAVALGTTACFGLLTGARIVQGWGYLTEPETDSLSHADGLLLAGGLLLVLSLALATRLLSTGQEKANRVPRDEIAGRRRAKKARRSSMEGTPSVRLKA